MHATKWTILTFYIPTFILPKNRRKLMIFFSSMLNAEYCCNKIKKISFNLRLLFGGFVTLSNIYHITTYAYALCGPHGRLAITCMYLCMC